MLQGPRTFLFLEHPFLPALWQREGPPGHISTDEAEGRDGETAGPTWPKTHIQAAARPLGNLRVGSGLRWKEGQEVGTEKELDQRGVGAPVLKRGPRRRAGCLGSPDCPHPAHWAPSGHPLANGGLVPARPGPEAGRGS